MTELSFRVEMLTVNADPGSLVPHLVDAAGRRKRVDPEVGQLWDAYREALARVGELEAQLRGKKR